MQWRITVTGANGTDKGAVGPDGGIASLTDFSVDAAGSCLEASFVALPSAVDISVRDIVRFETYDSEMLGGYARHWTGYVTMAGNPRSSDLQEYRAVGMKQRLYERVLTLPVVEGGDVGAMARTALSSITMPVGASYGAADLHTMLFELGDRYPNLESVGAFMDFLTESVGSFIVPTGESYVYAGVTYTAGQTVPAAMWGADKVGRVFLRRPQEPSVTADEGDSDTRVTWNGVSAEEVVTSPVLVYASGMVADGWREYNYHEGGRPLMGADPVRYLAPMPVRPLHAVPLGVGAGDAQALREVVGPLDYMTLVPAWTLFSQNGMTNYANAYDNSLTTYATGDSSTFEARVGVRSGDLGAPAEGIVRVRYKPTYPVAMSAGGLRPPRLVVQARSPGAVNVGVEYAQVTYDLPVGPGLPEMMDLYYPFLLPADMAATDRASATEVLVTAWMYQESGSTSYAPELYNIMFYVVDDADALRLAEGFLRAVTQEVATVEVQGLVEPLYAARTVTQSLDLTTVAGPVLSGLRVERTSYRVTIEDGFVTTFHIGQAFEPDLEAQRVVLERLARKANNAEIVSRPRVKP